jgi:hypothetical protein
MDCGALLLLQLRSRRFFVNVANSCEGRVANVFTAIPLKLIGQYEIAPSYILPLGPCLRVAFSVRFHAKHCGHSSAFSSRSHGFLNQHPFPRSKPSNRTISSFTGDHSSFETIDAFLDRKRTCAEQNGTPALAMTFNGTVVMPLRGRRRPQFASRY